MKTMEESLKEWAKAQTTETLKRWRSNMKKSNSEKANMSKMAKEMTMAACEEMKNR
jgi:hypothetical protein